VFGDVDTVASEAASSSAPAAEEAPNLEAPATLHALPQPAAESTTAPPAVDADDSTDEHVSSDDNEGFMARIRASVPTPGGTSAPVATAAAPGADPLPAGWGRPLDPLSGWPIRKPFNAAELFDQFERIVIVAGPSGGNVFPGYIGQQGRVDRRYLKKVKNMNELEYRYNIVLDNGNTALCARGDKIRRIRYPYRYNTLSGAPPGGGGGGDSSGLDRSDRDEPDEPDSDRSPRKQAALAASMLGGVWGTPTDITDRVVETLPHED
jgi:hypothetical protein